MINVYSTHKLVQQIKKAVVTHALPYEIIEVYPNKELKFSVADGEPYYIYPTNKELRDISSELVEKEESHLVYVLEGKFALVEKGGIHDERIVEETEETDELAELKKLMMDDYPDEEEGVPTGDQIRLVSIEELEPVNDVEDGAQSNEVGSDDSVEAPQETTETKDESLVAEDSESDTEALESDKEYSQDGQQESAVDEEKSYEGITQPKKDNFYPNSRNKKRNKNN